MAILGEKKEAVSGRLGWGPNTVATLD